MTVGIAAIAENDGDPHVVVSADRMVTVGQEGGVEYEDTESKLEPFLHTDDTCAVAVGSGHSTYIDEIMDTLQTFVAGERIVTVREAMNYCLGAYQHVIRTTVNNRILAPLGYKLGDLKDEDVNIPPEIQRSIAEQIANYRERLSGRVNILIAGVGQDGPGVFLVSGGDFTNYTDMGYGVIGTGGDSARLTLIRRRFDRNCSLREGVFTVLEAKSQSEERQGVGQQMDMALVKQDSIRPISNSGIDELREMLDDIEEEERLARENVMEEWDNN